MTHISIVGAGKMGQAIAGIVTRGGNTVELLDNTTSQAVSGEIVVLAVPYGALDDVIAQRAGELAGKIVVDITNPLNFETFDSLLVPADSSAAAKVAAALPESQVLKAFNTTFSGVLEAGTVGPQKATVLIAGDDEAAKKALADVVTAGGLDAVDAGSLSRARELESVGFLQLTLAAAGKISWTGGFALVN
ncbi:NADPH-dependent F420 reductase [Branchiibius cervicis]|uniref:NADPH-dependent F420 reductase n=1 Tax=Branchiibius cervicis TaxID=908252 RepID=A0ABW2AVI7_9MICO